MESAREIWLKLKANGLGSITPSDERPDPVEQAKKDAEAYNNSTGKLEGYDCPKCKNRGDFMEVDVHNGYPYTPHRQCSCMKIRYSIARLERSGLKDAIYRCKFDNYETPEEWQAQAKKAAQDYAANSLDEYGQGKWFVMLGQPGCGKTHLCTAVCRELLWQEHEVSYVPWRDAMAQLKHSMMDEEEYTKIMGKLQQVDVLYLDDLFKPIKGEGITASDIKLTYDIINWRYVKRMRTVISGEMYVAEMMELDEATASRIVEMSKGSRVVIAREPGRNWRMKDA